MQEHCPIAYYSQALSTRAQGKPIYEQELMVVVLVVQRWQHYLLGRKFTMTLTSTQVLDGAKRGPTSISK